MLARAMISLFWVIKSHQKGHEVRTIVCCTKYYQNDFFVQLRLCERRYSPVIIWLLQFASVKISQNFKLWNLSCRSCKSRRKKKRVTKAVPTLGRTQTNMFTGPANFRKFHRRKRDKSCSKDPFFPCRKVCVNFRICRVICRLLAIFPWCFLFNWPIFQV